MKTFDEMLERRMKNKEFSEEYTKLKKNMKKLDEIAELESNWNQRGANAIDKGLLFGNIFKKRFK